MAQQQLPPLDEIQDRMPLIIEWHVSQNGGQPMDENMIHRYISESRFFDWTSKNGITFDQGKVDMQTYLRVGNRKALEDQLKRQKGVEYMIVGEPQQLPGRPKVEGGVGGNGMWLIRKQDRDRVQAPDGSGRWQEKLTVLGTYFIVGENMYQAPSIGDVVGNRLTAAANELAKFYNTAKNLPTFEPERGYSYLPQSTSTQKTASTNVSATGTPSRSREGSLVPGAGAETQSLRSASLLPETNGNTSSQGSNYQQAMMLAESFKNTLEFADDFLDENPLIGEPGNFTYTLTTQAVKKRRADAEAELAALTAAAKAKESQVNSKVATPAGKAEKPPSPPAVMTEKAVKETREREKDRRGSKIEKIKRKKSRHSIAPSTPLSAGTGSAPNSAI